MPTAASSDLELVENDSMQTPYVPSMCSAYVSDLSGVGLCIHDLKTGVTIYDSQGVADIYGCTVEECQRLYGTEDRFVKMLAPEHRQRFIDFFDALRKEPKGYRIEYRVMSARGSWIDILEIGEVFHSPSDEQWIVCCCMDVSEQKKRQISIEAARDYFERCANERARALSSAIVEAMDARREATDASEKLLAAADTMADGLLVLDKHNHIAFYNRTYLHHLLPQLASRIRVGVNFFDVLAETAAEVPLYHRDMGPDFLDRTLTLHQVRASDYELQLSDDRWMRVRSQSLPAGGRVIITSDITALKTAQLALEESEQLLRVIANSHPVPVAIVDIKDGHLLHASRPARVLLSLDDKTWHEYSFLQCLSQKDYASVLRLASIDAGVKSYETNLIKVGGEHVPVSISAQTVRYGDCDAIALAIQDLSDRHRAEAELRAQREALQYQEKKHALTALLAEVAHELNNPLSIVVGQSQMLASAVRDAELNEKVRRISVAAQRCAKILQAFHLIERMEQPEFRSASLSHIIKVSLDVAAEEIAEAGVQIGIQEEPGLPLLEADANQLGQAILSVIACLSQTMEEKAGTKRIDLRARFLRKKGVLRLSIANNGNMCKEKASDRLADISSLRPLTSQARGGMSLCEAIVEAHGGTVDFLCGKSGSAKVVIDLPVSRMGSTEPFDHQAQDGRVSRRARHLAAKGGASNRPSLSTLVADALLGKDIGKQ